MEGGEPAAYAYDAAGACLTAQLARSPMLCFSAACAPCELARARHALTNATHTPLRTRGRRAEAPSRAAAAGQPPADPADDAGAADGAGAGAGADGAAVALPKEVTQPVWLLAFNRFAADRRRELRAENENRSGTEAERLIGIQWRSMPSVRACSPTPPSASASHDLRRMHATFGTRQLTHELTRCHVDCTRMRRVCTSSALRRSATASSPRSSVRLPFACWLRR
jgi:hypothetical protein